jgi:single-stranded-DNA-specific exonuclease
MKLNWQILKPSLKSTQAIRKALKCSHIIASILANRGISSESQALSFMSPMLKNIRSPFYLKDIKIAALRISKAIKNNEKILIFGDYDTDGITGVTILFRFLQYAGADVSYYIPHREREGYGLKPEHIHEVAVPENVSLIITVDCGASDNKAVDAANSRNIHVIITDHHHVPKMPPQATALINPKQNGCNSGLDHLAGAGVAFYLVIYLRKHLRDIGFWNTLPEPNLKQYCDLVALGTVADIVPLHYENRIFTKAGLDHIRDGNGVGIQALMQVSKIKRSELNSEDISFRLAPRLNAAGRMDHAQIAVQLLTTDNKKTAMDIALSLNRMNTQRQDIQKQIIDEIELFLNKNRNMLDRKTLVLYHRKWHEGILGIAAARLTKKYYRPVILISIKDQIGKGSARSIRGVDIYKCLTACASDLESYGGHSLAAGLRIDPEKIKQFIENFENIVKETALPDTFIPEISIDFALNFSGISGSLINELERLGPYGSGNPEPLFMSRHIKVLFSEIVGQNHRRMRVKQVSDTTDQSINAIQFNIDTNLPQPQYFEKIAYSLKWNHRTRRKSIQLVIKATDFD